MGLFALAKHTYGIVCFASTAWAGAVTFGFLQSTAIACFAYSLPDATFHW